MKKLIAIALTVAMMLTVCVISASAAAAPELLAQGAANVQVGDDYTVSIRLNDADDLVGGFQGELAYTGASFKSIQVNPQVTGYNNTDDATTVIKEDDDSVNFATVADLKGTNPATRIWFKVTFTINSTNPTFTLGNVVFSDKEANKITGTVGAALAPTVPAAEATKITLNKVGIIEQVMPNDQAIVVNAGLENVKDDVTEFGVVFYPTSLLAGAELTVDTAGAVKASVTKENAKFQKFADAGSFNAVLHFNFSSDENAAKFLGTKVSARVYYKTAKGTFYSANTVSGDKYIQGGVADKAALNTILDFGDKVETAKGEVSIDAYTTAKARLATSNGDWYNNRLTVLKFAVENAK